jgi:hypothetical protein
MAVPSTGFTLSHWSGDCAFEKTKNYLLLPMDQDKKCSAIFIKALAQ